MLASLFAPRATSNPPADPAAALAPKPGTVRPERNPGGTTASGQRVTTSSARTVASAYRCANIISDDIGKLPLQVFRSRQTGEIERVQPNAVLSDLAWRLERKPNRWWSPFLFKKTAIQWLLFWGNTYVWSPTGMLGEKFILRADVTYPTFDDQGNLWYATRFPNGSTELIPAVEVLQLMINSDDGYIGRSVITFAQETLGRQLGAYEGRNKLEAQAFNAAGIIFVAGEADQAMRTKIRQAYTEATSGSAGIARVAVFDEKITKFEPVTMKASDMQWLEGIEATDAEIANFFGMPLHKLNLGKQSYESNEQQQLDYLSTTLDPYLVQWEQAALLKWVLEAEQGYTYCKFERSALLRTDPKTRGEYLNGAIQNMRMSPNEARQIEDRPGFEGGNKLYGPVNLAPMGETKE